MPKLFMIIIGCKPAKRHTEQHDIFFGIAETVKDLVPEIIEFWPEAKGKLHLDAYREVTQVGNYSVEVIPKNELEQQNLGLFFINLGGYKPGVFDELHYKMIVVAPDKATAIKEAKESAFYKHTGFDAATSHIDEKYGVDVDDIFEIEDILAKGARKLYNLKFTPNPGGLEDKISLGYFQLHKL